MNINETTNMNANITLKDSNGADVVVAYLSASVGDNISININVSNKTLLNAANATNAAGETAETQYAAFETAVKARAKELGYTIFA